jgi:hypothetical protein
MMNRYLLAALAMAASALPARAGVFKALAIERAEAGLPVGDLLPALPLAASPAAIAQPVPASAWGSMPPAVAAAFRGGDARAFYKACQASGFEPPASDDSQQNLLAEGASQIAADRFMLAPRKAALAPAGRTAPAPKQATVIDYNAFAAALDRHTGINAENIFAHTATKRAILAAAGYTVLYGEGGVRIPLEDATAAKIGAVFKKTWAAYRRRPSAR